MTLDVGLIGYGLGGATFHAPLIAATEGLRLAAIVTRDPARREAARRRYPSVRLLDRADELWASSPKPALIVVSSPSGTHAELARAAIRAGCHVVVDKPFAASSAEVAEIAALAEAAGRHAIPFQNRRWDGDFLTLQQVIAAGTLGRVRRLESRFERWRARAKPRWCEAGAREAAEGIVYDIGSHLIDQALTLFGPVREVYASLTRVRPGLQVEDEAFVALTHDGGERSHLYMSASAAAPGARFILSGERGAFVKHGLDGQEAALQHGADPSASGWSAEPRERWGTTTIDGRTDAVPTCMGAYGTFYPMVAAAIRAERPPPVAIGEAVRLLQVIEAVFASDASNRVIAPA